LDLNKEGGDVGLELKVTVPKVEEREIKAKELEEQEGAYGIQ